MDIAITQAVVSNLNISIGNKPNNTTNGSSAYTNKPYLGKPRPRLLVLGIDDSLKNTLTCQYCKVTGHLKENCVKLNQRLTLEKREPEKKVVSNNNSADRLPKQSGN